MERLDHWKGLVWPPSGAGLEERRRAVAIVRRVRGIALLFALLTVAWIAVDIAVFPAREWQPLAALRLVAALALFALAHACRFKAPTRAAARVRLALLFAIPVAFFVASLEILHDAPADAASRGVAAAYSFVPFLLAAGIATFPLAVAESALLALLAVAAEAWALASGRPPLMPLVGADAYWLLLLIAAVGAYVAASQLDLMYALVRQAMRDPLTGCMRRDGGQELLELQFRIAARQEKPLAVLFADIDRFKSVNDRFGHEVGDQVLARAAAALAGALRGSDLLVRWGGEEFVVAMPDTTNAAAVNVIERLRAHGVGRLPDGSAVTLSIGIAEYREDGATTADALVDIADQRMYAAKQAGRNRYVHSAGGAAIEMLAAE